MQLVPTRDSVTLDDYANSAMLVGPVFELRSEAKVLIPRLGNRRVLMVNSTAQGGGVAEMLPRMVTLLTEVGVRTRWAVIETQEQAFFTLTKRIHNLIHGQGNYEFTEEDRQVYEKVNRENAEQLKKELQPGDILVIHDPQPMAIAKFLREDGLDIRTVWRCHIGLDQHLPATRAAWGFLKPYAAAYDRAIFTAPGYIPDYFTTRASVIFPALDPASHKNRALPTHKVAGIAVNSGISRAHHEVLTPPFEHQAQRLQADGSFRGATEPDCAGILYLPTVTQISRWDRLKGFRPLMEGFVDLKERAYRDETRLEKRDFERIRLLRLVLAGPDPDSIQDDPEGVEVLNELIDLYKGVSPKVQGDIVLLALPMASRKRNALMVNVLQRCSTVVVQNSIQEGFGLTVTEAMWKGIPVLGTQLTGIRHQIRDGVDGRLAQDGSDSGEVSELLGTMLADAYGRSLMGETAQRRASEEFLIFKQLRRWLTELVEATATRPPDA